MRILLDFDYTIFDTEAMREALIEAFDPLGISEEQYREAEAEVTVNDLYSLEEHFSLLAGSTPEEELHRIAQEVFDNAEDFLYPDVIPFFKRHSEVPIVLLTFGNEDWQEFKASSTGIESLCEEVIATEKSKEDMISSLPKRESFVFINDKGSEIDAVHKVRPDIHTIWIRRDGAPYYNDRAYSADEEVSSLASLSFTEKI